ncbi:MAG: MFS transporter, partial [Lentisphaeria bacterium]|nr:MFS transporter [Lentisphaeria bacterium]
YPRTYLMRAGQGGRAILFLFLAFMIHINAPFWVFCLLFFLNSGTGVIFENSADAYLSSFTNSEDRPKSYSKSRIGVNIGWALGPAVGAFLASWPYEILFVITACICIASERYISFILHENTFSPLLSNSQQKSRAGESVWKDRYILLILSGVFLVVMLSSQLYSVLSVYATKIVGLSRRELGFVYFFNGFTIILGQLPVTALMEKLKISHNWRLVAGALFYFCGYFYLGFAKSFADVVCSVIILTVGELIVQVAIYAVITAAAPEGRVGRYLSAWILIRGIAAAMGPYIGSLLFGQLQDSPVILWSLLSGFGGTAAMVFAAIAVFRSVDAAGGKQ